MPTLVAQGLWGTEVKSRLSFKIGASPGGRKCDARMIFLPAGPGPGWSEMNLGRTGRLEKRRDAMRSFSPTVAGTLLHPRGSVTLWFSLLLTRATK